MNTSETSSRMDHLGTASQAKTLSMTQKKYWGSMLKFSLFALAFWLLEFAFEYYFINEKDLATSFVRSFAYAGTLLITFALLASVVFKWAPRLAMHWRIRRYLGVSGTIFIAFHILATLNFFMNYNVGLIFAKLNPLENPLMFGALAFLIFFVVSCVSTDWAQKKMGRSWKTVQRLVYVAYLFTVGHFLTIDPEGLKTLPGYILMLVTVLTLGGELFWYFKMAAQKKFKSWGTLAGIVIIVAYIGLFYVIAQKWR